jgi:hypothetical protein
MEQTSDPETLVIHQKLTPGNNPKKILSNITTPAEAFNYIIFYLFLFDFQNRLLFGTFPGLFRLSFW